MSKQEKMFGLVEEFQGSRLSARAFSREKDISLSTFNYWVRKKNQGMSSGGFIKVETGGPSSNNSLELVYPNGVRLQMASPDLPLIEKLLKLY